MKLLLQRVSYAEVVVDGECVGKIAQGLLVLVGYEADDSSANIYRGLDKMLSYRIFADDEGKMNRSVSDIEGGVLLVSQFTLAANTRKGLRPSFSSAAAPAIAQGLYDDSLNYLVDKLGERAQGGSFGADMKVSLLNDGPVTFMLEA